MLIKICHLTMHLTLYRDNYKNEVETIVDANGRGRLNMDDGNNGRGRLNMDAGNNGRGRLNMDDE